MLRKLIWTAIYGLFAALATLVARKAATGVYKIVAGEEPPRRQ
jgi:hypothetical protein